MVSQLWNITWTFIIHIALWKEKYVCEWLTHRRWFLSLSRGLLKWGLWVTDAASSSQRLEIRSVSEVIMHWWELNGIKFFLKLRIFTTRLVRVVPSVMRMLESCLLAYLVYAGASSTSCKCVFSFSTSFERTYGVGYELGEGNERRFKNLVDSR